METNDERYRSFKLYLWSKIFYKSKFLKKICRLVNKLIQYSLTEGVIAKLSL